MDCKIHLDHTLVCPTCREAVLASETRALNHDSSIPQTQAQNPQPKWSVPFRCNLSGKAHEKISIRKDPSELKENGSKKPPESTCVADEADKENIKPESINVHDTVFHDFDSDPDVPMAENIIQEADGILKRQRDELDVTDEWEKKILKKRRGLDDDFKGTASQVGTGHLGAGSGRISGKVHEKVITKNDWSKPTYLGVGSGNISGKVHEKVITKNDWFKPTYLGAGSGNISGKVHKKVITKNDWLKPTYLGAGSGNISGKVHEKVITKNDWLKPTYLGAGSGNISGKVHEKVITKNDWFKPTYLGAGSGNISGKVHEKVITKNDWLKPTYLGAGSGNISGKVHEKVITKNDWLKPTYLGAGSGNISRKVHEKVITKNERFKPTYLGAGSGNISGKVHEKVITKNDWFKPTYLGAGSGNISGKVHEKVTTKNDSSELKEDGAKKKPPESTCAADESEKKYIKQESINLHDTVFHDFDSDRTENSFGDNQVWAVYDHDNGMPRSYAMIHKVISSTPLKMEISWLYSKTSSEFGPVEWVSCGLPRSCGTLRIGKKVIVKSTSSFSHKVNWTKGAAPGTTVCVFPRKGDVWALYRNWSPDWDEITPDETIHRYKMVEVLEDYMEGQGAVSVAPLIKVGGFRSVFRADTDPGKVRMIEKKEMLRFSHQVPKYMLTGLEGGQDVPKGCLELDPAATPLELPQVITKAPPKEEPEEEKPGEEMLRSARPPPASAVVHQRPRWLRTVKKEG